MQLKFGNLYSPLNLLKTLFIIFFQGKGRKLYCSKGKFVKTSTCVHLTSFVKAVGYRIAFKVSLVTNGTDVYSSLRNLQMVLQHKFLNLYQNLVYLEFVEFYTFVDKPCSVLQIETQSEEEATVYLKLTMKQSNLLNKTAIEKNLLMT